MQHESWKPNMPSLEQLQRDFAGWLLGEPTDTISQLVDDRGIAPDDRLQIYRNMVTAIYSDALATSYPMIKRLVGDDFFDLICTRYIHRHPSTSGNLQFYGCDLAGMLAQMPEAAGIGYLGDVARLEWASQSCALAPLAKSTDPAHLAAIPEAGYEALQFALSPSLHLLRSTWPVLDIWLFCENPGDRRFDVAGAGQAIAIWRSEEQIAMAELDNAWHDFVATLANGETLGDAHESAIANDPGFDPAAALEWLFSEGLVTDLRVSGNLLPGV